MPSSTMIISVAAAYAVAFAVEMIGVKHRFAWHRLVLIAVSLFALAAHSLLLAQSAKNASALPLSTADWLLWAAWLLAVVYFAALFYLPRSPTGVVLLPIVAVLVLS